MHTEQYFTLETTQPLAGRDETLTLKEWKRIYGYPDNLLGRGKLVAAQSTTNASAATTAQTFILEITLGEAQAIGMALMRLRRELKADVCHSEELLTRVCEAYAKLDSCPTLCLTPRPASERTLPIAKDVIALAK